MMANPQKSVTPEKIRLAPMNSVIHPNRQSTRHAKRALISTSKPFATRALRSSDIEEFFS